jgi:hypothetical protein
MRYSVIAESGVAHAPVNPHLSGASDLGRAGADAVAGFTDHVLLVPQVGGIGPVTNASRARADVVPGFA